MAWTAQPMQPARRACLCAAVTAMGLLRPPHSARARGPTAALRGGRAGRAPTSAAPVPTTTHREVAAKCVSLRKMSLERIEREVAITKKVAHEHVIGVYGAARRRDEYVIFLELCKEELFALVERRSTLSEKECKSFMSQLLSAVNHIHK